MQSKRGDGLPKAISPGQGSSVPPRTKYPTSLEEVPDIEGDLASALSSIPTSKLVLCS